MAARPLLRGSIPIEGRNGSSTTPSSAKSGATFSPSGITARPPARVISPLSISFGNARIGEADLYRGLSARKNERLTNGRLWRKKAVNTPTGFRGRQQIRRKHTHSH